ncbi:unnamed protein product [Anisakis simplex]|uniref:TAZ-type domain-containing protein n=1 Tax=Anisakis simplex TaxID=6269 RepID=A0A0M3KAZ5_ANISI|nr:unnamed protein product [Anisakis simplex]
MRCPKMEQCSLNCMNKGLESALPCVIKHCNVHCFDGDCPQCASMAKRIFLHICRENDVPHLPMVMFNGTCLGLFDKVVRKYIDANKNND